MTTNVLITSASRKVSLVQAWQQALKLESGGKVVAVDASAQAAALYVADQGVIAPRGLDNDFWEFIVSVIDEHDIDIVVPTRDEELPLFAQKAVFIPDVCFLISSPDSVRICQDKRAFIDFCVANGFSVARTYQHDESPVQFPVFIRERYGKGSKQAFRVNSKADLELLLAKLDDPIIQEFIDWQEYTIDLFADFENRVISVIPRERVIVLGGESFIGRTRHIPALIEQASALATALKLNSHNTIQCFYKEGQSPLFIEVNPRYGGGAALGFAAGALTPRFAIQLQNGQQLQPQIGKFTDNLMMLRYTQDHFVHADDMLDEN